MAMPCVPVQILCAALFAVHLHGGDTWAHRVKASEARSGGPDEDTDAASPASRTAGRSVPPILLINACQRRKAPVTFPHRLHTEKNNIKCVRCHHKNRPQKSCASAGCHPGRMRGKIPGCFWEGKIKKNPYHIMCRSCHKPHSQNTGHLKGARVVP